MSRIRLALAVAFVVLASACAPSTDAEKEKPETPLEHCEKEIERIARETGQPAGSPDQVRRACEANVAGVGAADEIPESQVQAAEVIGGAVWGADPVAGDL